MADMGAWWAVAGLGALHGLNPATGWVFAAGWGVRARARSGALRALLPIAAGHALAVAAVAAAVVAGGAMDRGAMQLGAGALLVLLALVHLSCGARWRARLPAGQLGLGLWSFMVASAQGAGLMLVPALVPLCLGDAPARSLIASGSLAQALAAIGVHMAAMLAVSGAIALAACHGVARCTGLWRAVRGRGP